MLLLFPDGELPDFSQIDTSPLNLDIFDVDDWAGVPETTTSTLRTDSAPGNASGHMALSDWQSGE